MKFKSLISMMAIAAIVFAGCEKNLPEPEDPNQEQPTPEPEPVVGEITLKGEESLTFSCEGGSQNVAFEATLEWTATASEEFVTVGPESGEAGDNLKITVSVPEYEGYDDRTATVTLTCGDDTKTIQVTQKKKGALVLAPSTIQVPAEGKSLSIVVQANSNVTAAIADDAKAWISELKGLVDYGFTFVIAPNEAVESRTGQIVFTNETGETETITLEQAGTPIVGKITLQGEDAFTVSDEGGQLEVAFNATLGWTASSSEEFVTVEPKTGEAGDVSVTLTVAENDSYDPRTATVTLTCDEDVKTIEITQKQKGALLFTESTIAVSAEGGNVEVVAKANSNVTYAIADDAKAWISELKGLVEYKFNFIVNVNESELARTGQIVFTNETGQTETVTIQQAGTEALSFAANFAVEGVAPFKTLWANGDVVAVNGVVSDALVLDAAAATADFVVRDKLEAPFNAIYPASVLKAETADVVTLPAQAYVTEVAPEVVLPMAAQAQEKALAFKQLCSVVKFTVKSEEAYKLDYAELSASQKLHGDFTVDYSFATLTAVGATDAEKTLRCELDNDLTAEGVNLYFVVPAAEYTSLALRLVDVDGLPMTYTTTETFTAEAGTVVEVPAFEFKPDQISIATAAELVKFATLYNANKLDSKVKVTLVDDITFDETTSAEYAATGGIGVRYGEGAHYFNGVFNGNYKTVKGYKANVPLFAAIDTYGTLKDLTIDNTSSFTFDAASLTEMAPVVGYHKGLMQNVKVNADITFAKAEVTSDKHIGGICARIREGKVENSEYTGNIYVPATFSAIPDPTNADSKSSKIFLGGIVGWISNANGVVSDTDFSGTLNFAGLVASTDKTNPCLMIGGIAGANAGTLSECSVTGEKKTTVANDTHSYATGSIGNVSTKAYFSAEGGIVGLNEGAVKNCINSANIINLVKRTGADGTAGDANSRYLYVGGIAGYNRAGEISGCTNYGFNYNRATPRLHKHGGIVGYNSGSVKDCVNETTGTITVATTGDDSFSARLPYVGGVIGENTSASVSNVQNKANLAISRIENSANSEIRLGGVIGSTTAEIDGTTSQNISNSGNLSVENSISNVTLGIFEGGVIGWTSASVKNVKNTGKLTHKNTTSLQKLYLSGVVGSVVSAANVEISGCENEGEVYFQAATASKDGEVEYTNNFLGGVLAYSISDVTVSDCQNGGYVHGGNSTKLNTKTLYVGGVVGYLMGKSSIVSCVNTGKVYNDHSNNSQDKALSVYAGGVVAFVEGTAANPIAVTNCSVTTADKEAVLFGHRRGYAGGIAGYAEYATLTGCTNDRNFNGSAYYLGGIAGWVVNSSIVNCDWTGTSMTSSQLQNAGGIVARLGAGSVVDGCKSYLETLAKGGTIAGLTEAGAVVRNCHYKTTSGLGVCSDANATQENNVADL